MKLRMRLRLAGAVNPPDGLKALNVEHRTLNIDVRRSFFFGSRMLSASLANAKKRRPLQRIIWWVSVVAGINFK